MAAVSLGPVQGGALVQYLPWDFHQHAKRRGSQVLAEIAPTITACLDRIGVFACPPSPPDPHAHRQAAAAWVRHLSLSTSANDQ